MFNKNKHVPDGSPTGGQLCCKLPTVTSAILKIYETATSLAIFIVGCSQIRLVLEALVPLRSASCIYNRTCWCPSTGVLMLPLSPSDTIHYTTILRAHARSLKKQLSLRATIKIILLHRVPFKKMLLPPESV